MSRFLPTRASPPLRSISEINQHDSVAIPELARLTPEQVSLLDAVIERAGPSATTFLTVWKAYNDVLSARGLDPHEVLYYGKLLKLGTLKGRNWGDKWNAVKQLHGYHAASVPPHARQAGYLSGINQTTKEAPHPPHTLSSRGRGVVYMPSESGTDTHVDSPQYHRDPRLLRTQLPRPSSPSPSSITANSTDIDSFPLLSKPAAAARRGPRRYDPSEEDIPTYTQSALSTQRPYSVALENSIVAEPHARMQRLTALTEHHLGSRVVASSSAAHQAVAKAKKQKGTVANESDAWKRIQWDRDEQDADKFYQDVLVERCWQIWRQGYLWICVWFSFSLNATTVLNEATVNKSTNLRSSR